MLRQIKYFQAVVRCGSFTEAAADSDEIALEQTTDGILVRGDNLQDVTITAESQTDTQTLTFSTDADVALLSVELENELQMPAIKIDTDGDGSFETTVKHVTAITLDSTSLTMIVGDQVTLYPTITPENAIDKSVIWSSSAPNVATVDSNGVVTAVTSGTVTIVATADGGVTATCSIIVTDALSEPRTFTIAFNPSGGTVVPVSTRTNEIGKLTTLPTPMRSGYIFMGWYTAPSGGTAVDTDTVFDQNTTIYAQWKRRSSSDDDAYITSFLPENTGNSVSETTLAVDDADDASTLNTQGVDASSFTDVSTMAYYYDAVVWAVENNITSGTSETTFSPEEFCTRAQVITFLWRAIGCLEASKTAISFTDVSADDYYHKAVLWATENGITTGTTVTTFAPDDACTRGQALTFLYREFAE